MRIGTCVNFDSMQTIENKLIFLKDNGFDNCQLISWRPEIRTNENAVILKDLLAKHQITVSAFWCGWDGPVVWNFYEGQKTLGLVPPEFREMRIANLCEGADFAKLVGITDVITHMGFIPENPYDPLFEGFCDAVRKVATHLKNNDQNLLFETGQETPVTLLRCFETVGLDNLFINLDTANLILYGKANPVDALDVFGKFVRNLHAKDGTYPTNGHDLGFETKLGSGKVDFYSFFKKLKELGYNSFVTIENEIAEKDHNDEILQAKDYLENIIKEIY